MTAIAPDAALVLARPGETTGTFLRGVEARPFRCALGRSGIVPGRAKREGDGATPEAVLPLRRLLFRADRLARPRATVPAAPIAPDDLWCDDASAPEYNRPVRAPFGPSHERLWMEEPLYDLVGVLGWNDDPPVPGRGSAIFLHLARPGLAPTEGCIALPLPDLLAVLPGLRVIEVRLE